MSEQPDLVEQYLRRLDEALSQRGCPPQRRSEILEEVTRHIGDSRAALTGPADEAAVRTILDHVGDPDDIAAEASFEPRVGASITEMASRRGGLRRWLLEGAAAVILLATIGVLAGVDATQPSPGPQAVIGIGAFGFCPVPAGVPSSHGNASSRIVQRPLPAKNQVRVATPRTIICRPAGPTVILRRGNQVGR